MNQLILAFAVILVFAGCQKKTYLPRQLTSAPNNHDMDNNLNFSPDSRWLCYDTRAVEGGIANTQTIEKADIKSGAIKYLYNVKNFVLNQGPGVGAVSYFPGKDNLIFIHGPETTKNLNYTQTRRYGAIISDDGSSKIIVADARDVRIPFTPGALRGGTHRHEPGGPNGNWIGFTYNDQIMKEYGRSIGQNLDLRTVGVTKLGQPVTVENDASGECWSGAGFSVLVVKVVPQPRPGSNEISRAYGDGWVGKIGYLKKDGTRQLARGFIGELANGHTEVFIVDIPADITLPGPDGPLAGTATTRPMPPRGTVQRRLTTTKFGCQGDVRSHPNGSYLCYRALDTLKIWQLFLISPHGGEPIQLTTELQDIQSTGRWHPVGDWIFYVTKNSIKVVRSNSERPDFGKAIPLTEPFETVPEKLVVAPNGEVIGYNRKIDNYLQIFTLELQEKIFEDN